MAKNRYQRSLKSNGAVTATGVGVGQSKRLRSPRADIAHDPSPTGRSALQKARKLTNLGYSDLIKIKKEQNYANRGGKLRKSLGKNWQKKVYGKGYKYGTIKNMNKLQQERSKRNTNIKSKKQKLEKNLATSENKSAIEQRLSKLNENAKKVSQNREATQVSKDKLLSLRDKAIKKLSTASNGQKEQMRKRAVKKKLSSNRKVKA